MQHKVELFSSAETKYNQEDSVQETSAELSPATGVGKKNMDASQIPSDEASEEVELVPVKRFLAPNGNKLYDFRAEPIFGAIAKKTISEEKTLLDYNRLFTLFFAVRNTHELGLSVAEVGTYRGGSAKFLARSFEHFEKSPSIHVFDTFLGHPESIVSSLDGKHKTGLFSDTDASSVREYLSEFENISVHVGAIEERCVDVEQELFSLVHVDVDIYSASISCLNFFWPRLVSGGIMVLDDYGFTTCLGVKQAVDYFLSITEGVCAWYIHSGQFVLQKTGAISLDRSGASVEAEIEKAASHARLMEQQQIIQTLQSQLIERSVAIESTKNFYEGERSKLKEELLRLRNLLESEQQENSGLKEETSALKKRASLLNEEIAALKQNLQTLHAKEKERESVIADLNVYIHKINSHPLVRCARAVRNMFR